MDKAKPFNIPKREVWEAYKQVRANQGAAGIFVRDRSPSFVKTGFPLATSSRAADMR